MSENDVFLHMAGEGLSKNHVHLKKVITNPNIEVGEYTFYHDFDDPRQFQSKNAGYFPGPPMEDKLIIGKYCSLAHGIKFLSSVTNHQMDGFSTYPFSVIWGEESGCTYDFPKKGDTVIGNDVWIGLDAVIMPGIKIGDGAIIGTRAVVTKHVPPYSIVGGNPATVIRPRFEDETIGRLLEIAWWDWPNEMVIKHASLIAGADIEALEDVKATLAL